MAQPRSSQFHSDNMRPRLIGISGASCTGKTWLASQLQASLGPLAERLSLDDFYKDLSHLSPRQRHRVNFDHPRAIDWKSVEAVMEACRSDRQLTLPTYDFATHTRSAQGRPCPVRPIILMEGLWLFRNPRIRHHFDLRLFLSCPAQVCQERRIHRDVVERGRTREFVLQQYATFVVPMQERFVAPQSRWAHMVLESPIDRQTVVGIAGQISALAGLIIPKVR